MVRLCLPLTVIVALVVVVHAQKVVQDDWVNPSLPDESTVLTTGTTCNIEWTSQLYIWFSTYAPNANVSNLDLYITGTDITTYQHLIQSGVNIRTTRSIAWTVSLPSNELSNTPYYTFRFVKAGTTFTSLAGQQISSPQMIVRAGSSSPSITANSATASTTSGAATSNVVNQPAQPTQPASSSGLSAGAIAGIVIGVVLGIASVAGVIVFIMMMRTRRREALQMSQISQTPPYPPLTTHMGHPGSFQGHHVTNSVPSTPEEYKSPLSPPSYRQHRMVAELSIVSSLDRSQLP